MQDLQLSTSKHLALELSFQRAGSTAGFAPAAYAGRCRAVQPNAVVTTTGLTNGLHTETGYPAVPSFTTAVPANAMAMGNDCTRSIAAMDAIGTEHRQGRASWLHTPKFGPTYHFQRWRRAT